MGKNTQFANEKESKGFEELKKFNEFLKLNDLNQTHKGDYFDASGATPLKKTIIIENKIREQVLLQDDNGKFYVSGSTKEGKSYSGDTLFIESHKIADLLLDYVVNGSIPLYVNYLKNHILVYKLHNLKHRPEKKHYRIFSQLYQSFEIADRQLLSLEDAYIFQKMENNTFQLIHQP